MMSNSSIFLPLFLSCWSLYVHQQSRRWVEYFLTAEANQCKHIDMSMHSLSPFSIGSMMACNRCSVISSHTHLSNVCVGFYTHWLRTYETELEENKAMEGDTSFRASICDALVTACTETAPATKNTFNGNGMLHFICHLYMTFVHVFFFLLFLFSFVVTWSFVKNILFVCLTLDSTQTFFNTFKPVHVWANSWPSQPVKHLG